MTAISAFLACLKVFKRFHKAYCLIDECLASYYRLCGLTDWHTSNANPSVHSLRAEEVIRFTPKTRARFIDVIRGTVGLTGMSANGDLLIREGERLQLIGNRSCVVKAVDGDAEIRLLP